MAVFSDEPSPESPPTVPTAMRIVDARQSLEFVVPDGADGRRRHPLPGSSPDRKRTMAAAAADGEEEEEREEKATTAYPIVKRVKRTHVVPDVGATVRQMARAMGRRADLCLDLYPPVVRALSADRVSVFTVLDSAELGTQPFSLDNGMALQDTLDWWLRRYRQPRLPVARDALRLLKKHREPLGVRWEGRDLRVWTWPAEQRRDLVAVLRRILSALCHRGASDHRACAGSEHGWSDPADACIPCTRRLGEELLDTYKCFHLVDAYRRPLFHRSEATAAAAAVGQWPQLTFYRPSPVPASSHPADPVQPDACGQ